MQLKPLGAFGVEVRELDLRQTDAPRQLIDLVAENHIAVFRDQTLTKPDYDRFGRIWGRPIDFFFMPDLDKDFPALIRLSNSPEHDPVRQNGAAFWHTDGSYEHLPASFTMLYALEAPDQGGETLFVDLTAAYEALPEETRARIDGLQVRHKLLGGKRGGDEIALQIDPDTSDKDGGVRARKRASEQPVHPLALTHPITGRKSLYAISGTPFAVVDMEEAEGQALLEELKAHALQPRFIVSVKACKGDVLIWDNFCTLHRATPIEHSSEDGKRRSLLRISTNGLPPAYGERTPAFEARPDIEVVRFAGAAAS